MTKPQQDLSHSVLAEIETKHICIKSKASILVGSLAMGVGLALLVTLAVVAISFVLYQLRVMGTFGFLWFGLVGLSPFVHTVPWTWIGTSIALLILGYLLLKQYDFSYKTGYQGILLTFCFSILGLALVIDRVGLHEQISRQPVFKNIYSVNFKGPNWITGEVIIASSSGMIIITPQHEQYIIRYSSNTRLPSGFNFRPGIKIQTIGSFVDDLFEADGITFR